jgi:hypothetical protein
MVCVVMLNVVMLSVVAPYSILIYSKEIIIELTSIQFRKLRTNSRVKFELNKKPLIRMGRVVH